MNRLVGWLFERGVRRSCLVIIPSIFFVRRSFESKRQIVKSRLQSCTRRWSNVNGIFIWFCGTFCKLSLLTFLYFWEHMRHMEKLPGWLMDSLSLFLALMLTLTLSVSFIWLFYISSCYFHFPCILLGGLYNKLSLFVALVCCLFGQSCQIKISN